MTGSGPESGAQDARVAVLGLGNVLMQDDALGPYAVRTLAATYSFAPEVRVQDVGTPGLDLTPFLSGLDAVVLVDTVKSDGPPGDVRLYRRDEILRHPPPVRVSPHDPGVKEALLSLEFAGAGPRQVLLIGAIPQSTGQGIGLSAPVRAALPRVRQEVLDELERLGFPAVLRETPLDPDLWWER